MELYINSTGIISAAGHSGDKGFLRTAPQYEATSLPCAEPGYQGVIAPMQLRRMSKAVRMGIGASTMALKAAGLERADALSVGTGMGCLYDTEIFLSKMIDQEEQLLTPTSFIQSTHNTVAGQIALLTKCHGHNLTFVQGGHSFEQAIINTQLYLNEHPGHTMLAGGIDELIPASHHLMQRAGVYSEAPLSPWDVIETKHQGSIASEGAAFFTITAKANAQSKLVVRNITTYRATDVKTALLGVAEFLCLNQMSGIDADLVIMGINGDDRQRPFYRELCREPFVLSSQAAFKQLSGEYATASAFALGMLMQPKLPAHVYLHNTLNRIKNVVIINSYLQDYSCWLLEVLR